MNIKELLSKKIDDAKKDKLIDVLLDLHRILKNKKQVVDNLKEIFEVELTDELISFIEGLDISKYDLVVEIDELGHVGIGTTNPKQEMFFIK